MASSDGDSKLTKSAASNLNTELSTGKFRRGGDLTAADKSVRINKLKAYSLTLASRFQQTLNTKIAGFEADLKQQIIAVGNKTTADVNSHVTSEADRIIDAIKEKSQPVPHHNAVQENVSRLRHPIHPQLQCSAFTAHHNAFRCHTMPYVVIH